MMQYKGYSGKVEYDDDAEILAPRCFKWVV